MWKAVVTGLLATLALAMLQIIVNVVAWLILSDTTVSIRYVGQIQGQSAYAIVAENEAFKRSERVVMSVVSATPPTVLSYSGSRPALGAGGRAGETRIDLGSIDRNQRASLVLAFAPTPDLPTFLDEQTPAYRILTDAEPSRRSLESTFWSTLPMALLVMLFTTLNFARVYELKRDLDRNSTRLDEAKENIEKHSKDRSEEAERIRARINLLQKSQARHRLLYERRISFLIQENKFWRKVGEDIFRVKASAPATPNEMLKKLLTRIGVRANLEDDTMTEEELLTHLEEENESDVAFFGIDATKPDRT